MTEKEIIIDGIKVSECCFFDNGKCRNPNICTCNCSNVYYCYFKEYQRKTKECEKYEQALNEIEEFIITDTCEPCKELEEDNCDECNGRIILDIINKAKGGE